MIDLLRRGFHDEISVGVLTDALRRHASEAPIEDLEQLATALDPFLRAVPDAIGHSLAMSKDPRCGRSIAFATGSILNYLFDESDLLPEDSFGILGLVDDAYLVHAFVAMVIQMYPFVEPPHVAHAPPDARLFEVVASFLPEGVAHALLRTCETTIQVAQALFPATDGSDTSSPTFRPEIRVGAAVQALTGPI